MATITEREPLGQILLGATLAHAVGVEHPAGELVGWAVRVLEAEARLLRLTEARADTQQSPQCL